MLIGYCLDSSQSEDCPEEFATAVMLYCHGACGDDWADVEEGCQEADANAFCKLNLCDGNAFATSYEVTLATREPGFSCDGRGDVFEGEWFGINDVYYTNDTRGAHGQGYVISNAVCVGKYNYVLEQHRNI